jgi:hypothetical protein
MWRIHSQGVYLNTNINKEKIYRDFTGFSVIFGKAG